MLADGCVGYCEYVVFFTVFDVELDTRISWPFEVFSNDKMKVLVNEMIVIAYESFERPRIEN